MLLDTSRFSFIPPVEAGFEVFRRELEQLDRDDFVPWPDRAAYHGEWLTLPLVMERGPDEMKALCERNQDLCPESTALLRTIPRLATAGFSRMEPNCHILPHTDLKPDDLLRAHLPLSVPDGALMRVGEDRHTWEQGRCILFDGAIEHETANLGVKPRVVVLVDAYLTDEELAYLRTTQ